MAENTAGTRRAHRPVLLIGMGGTGKQVLLNLRRMFYDHFGKPTLDHIGHIWIDTDPRSMTLDGQEMNFLLKEVDFDATERVNTELSSADLQNYYDHKNAHPHIFSWFDPSLEKHGRIENGAGQIRSFGRLAFFHHYQEIMERIRDKYSDIRDAGRHAALLNEHGIHVDASKVDAWLVFSVAGGTGSGMFLDMAFALKEHDPKVNLRGMIVLPSVFHSDFQHKIFGNAYAALMELEHYNLARQSGDGSSSTAHRFPLAWTREQFLAGRSAPGPVFDTAYLIGNKPHGAGGTLALKDKNSLCEMLAESLFIEYGGHVEALATDWLSQRSNFADNLTGIIRYPYVGSKSSQPFEMEFSCRYSSLGLSKLHVPVQRIAMLVRHQLAGDLVDYWLRKPEIPSTMDELIARQFLPRLRLAERGRNGNFYRDLNGVGQGQPLDEALRQIFVAARADFLQGAAQPNIGERLREWLNENVLNGQLDNSNPDTNRWGSLTRLVYFQNSEALYTKVVAELDGVVREILAAPTQRVEFAREVLRRIGNLLEEQRQEFTKQAERAKVRAADALRDMTERLNWLGDCHGVFTRRTIVEVALGFAEQRANFELRAQICDAIVRITGRLADLIGRGTVSKDAKGREMVVETGLLKQLSDLERTLERDVRETLTNRVEALRQMPPSAIYQSLYEEHDFSDFYVTAQGRPIDGGALADLDRRFFEDGNEGHPHSLWDMRSLLQSEGGRRMIGVLLDFTRGSTLHLEDRTVDVVERLAQEARPDTQRYASALQRLLEFGQPWLAQPTHFINAPQTMRYKKSTITVALSSVADPNAREEFRKALSARWKTPLPIVDSAPHQVYVSSEVAGIPLMAIPDLDRYRNAGYFPALENGLVLHGDVNFEKFQDLMVKEQEEVDLYLAALEVLGMGILTGVVQGRHRDSGSSRKGVVEFVFEDPTSFFGDAIHLGPFSLAIRKLSAISAEHLREAIRRRTATVLDHLNDDGLARWIYLLRYTARYCPTGQGGLAATLDSIAQDLEIRNPHLVPMATRARDTLNHWSEENPAGSGFRRLVTEERVLV